MSDLGQKRTCAVHPAMSATGQQRTWHFRFKTKEAPTDATSWPIHYLSARQRLSHVFTAHRNKTGRHDGHPVFIAQVDYFAGALIRSAVKMVTSSLPTFLCQCTVFTPSAVLSPALNVLALPSSLV